MNKRVALTPTYWLKRAEEMLRLQPGEVRVRGWDRFWKRPEEWTTGEEPTDGRD